MNTVDSEPYVDIEKFCDHVYSIRLCRGPNNFFSFLMISAVAGALEELDNNDDCRVVVLCAEGKNFCAGADFSGSAPAYSTADLYGAAERLFRTRKPIVAAVQGAAIGGGLGLAMAADFRVVTTETRVSANFSRLGFHHGFGLSVTLPRAIGEQRAAELLMTGRRIDGAAAYSCGLADRLANPGNLLDESLELAKEIALSAPLAVESIRATLRGNIADQVHAATQHEMAEQLRLRQTDDFAEGAKAMAERRTPNFKRS
jgi:enoyl-CoA hydratase/carnithine racemase